MSSAPSPASNQNRQVRRVALLTAGGLAPCLSSAVGALIERYTEVAPLTEIIAYRGGYRGLLIGDSFVIGRNERDSAYLLHQRGGSPIGNSRVKLANVKDCVSKGYVKADELPLKVASEQLVKDRVDVLHTIGGDDTNLAAADLSKYLKANGYSLTVIGLPKTIDNDVVPIRQSLGALTAAEEGAKFFRNIVADNTANSSMLLVHEVMGRSCGWLTAATAKKYMDSIEREEFADVLNLGRGQHEVHAVYVPEMAIDLDAEVKRLRTVLAKHRVVNIFIAEGAGADQVVAACRKEGKHLPVDAFGHVKLDYINVGQWFGDRLQGELGIEKLLVQKSGYFSRAARANAQDLSLIKSCCDYAVDCAFSGLSGVVGHDEDYNGEMRAIEFERIRGGKKFDVATPWFAKLLSQIGQPLPGAAAAKL